MNVVRICQDVDVSHNGECSISSACSMYAKHIAPIQPARQLTIYAPQFLCKFSHA